MPALACAALFATALLSASPTHQAGTWAITDVTVIPADTDEVLTHRTVLVRDGRIAEVVAAGAEALPEGAVRIDGSGKFLVPGFVDAHVHLATEGAIRGSNDPVLAGLELGNEDAYNRHVLLSFLKAGVTGIANLGGSVHSDADLLRLRDAVAAGRMAGPRLFVGKRINGPRAAVAHPPAADVPASTPAAPTTAADGIAAVRDAHARGYDFIKPYQFLDRATYTAIVDEARHLGLPTTGHLPELGCAHCADRAHAFAHPLDNIAHAEELARYAKESDLSPADLIALADAVAASGAGVTPTLVTQRAIVHMYVEREVQPVPEEWLALVDPVTRRDWVPPRNRYLSQAFRDQEGAALFPVAYDVARLLTRELWKRGVPLTVGTDAALPGLPFGYSVHREMIELHHVGLPPIEVLRAASVNARRLLDPDGGSGAIRVGERADFVLLEADPRADIRNVSRVAGVSVGGRWWTSDQIDAELARTADDMASLAQRLREADATRGDGEG